MDFFCKYPDKVNKNNYRESDENTKVFYGLPKNFKFCKSCVISNQRPSTSVEFKNDGKQPKKAINFNDDGGKDFISAVKYKNIVGLQFHPERSGYEGLKLLDEIIKSLIKS